MATAASYNKSLQSFLEQLNVSDNHYRNTLITSRYDLEFYNFEQLSNDVLKTRCNAVTVPTIRRNFGRLYFNGQTIPIEGQPSFSTDISFTIICDEDVNIYEQFCKIISERNRPTFNDTYVDIYVNGQKENRFIRLHNVKFESISQLSFSYENSSVATFTVSGHVLNFDFYTNESEF